MAKEKTRAEAIAQVFWPLAGLISVLCWLVAGAMFLLHSTMSGLGLAEPSTVSFVETVFWTQLEALVLSAVGAPLIALKPKWVERGLGVTVIILLAPFWVAPIFAIVGYGRWCCFRERHDYKWADKLALVKKCARCGREEDARFPTDL